MAAARVVGLGLRFALSAPPLRAPQGFAPAEANDRKKPKTELKEKTKRQKRLDPADLWC